MNPRQARALLEAVRAQQPSGPRLVAFFAVMYYAGLRPEEAINLSRDNVILPPRWDRTPAWQDPPMTDWGELHLRSATPDAGSEWTDDGSARETRQLKHRAEGDSRIVPTHPELTRLLRDHLANFGHGSGRPPVRRRPGRRAAHHHLPPRLDQSTPGRRSPQPSKPLRSPGGRTTCGMPACPRG